MVDDELAYIEHIGIKRKSGRYPWGSGKDPYQRSVGFKAYYDELKKSGMRDTEIAKGIEDHLVAAMKPGEYRPSFKTTDLRAAIAVSTEEIRRENQAFAKTLKAKGMSNIAIAERMGLGRTGESTVRGWLKDSETIKENSILATANRLKARLDEIPADAVLDVGKGNELYMGISETRLRQAIAALRDEGYVQHPIKQPQLGTGEKTDLKVLAKEGVTWGEAKDAVFAGRLYNMTDHSTDNGSTWSSPKTMPVSAKLSRVDVRYKDDGGDKMDGVIELRRNVDDISLGGANYAQVRVAVNGTHFLKGMAMYADDLPDGVDIRFNTNKTKAEAPTKLDAMKPLKTIKDTGEVDIENPFGGTTYPRMYTDAKGKEHQSVLNIVGAHGSGNIEGRWQDWSRALSSQMLSKQSLKLANDQLMEARRAKRADLDEIMSLTNPVVKKKLLDEFADSADAAAVHLKAASLPRQTNAVILPLSTIRPNQIYAPNHDHGEKVVLVRHPHGGPFEIPELVVNNRNPEARRVMGGAKDAVGIHASVAAQLSGADFDGDTVLVIPNNSGRVKTRPPLDGLKNFEPKERYKIADDDTTTTRMTKQGTQREMGRISNLITDMSIHGANDDELARAIRHSMVVIDAEKHGLDYKQSEKDNNIAGLKETYQRDATSSRGAATIISRASSDARVPERKLRSAADGGPVDPKTGELVYVETGRTNTKVTEKTYKRTGETVTTVEEIPRTTKGTRMEFAKDARDLLSSKDNPQPMEEVYASHANEMKAMANEARRVAHPDNLRMPKQSPAARTLYAKEVASLNAKLQLAERNAPLERKAQNLAGAIARARISANPEITKEDAKKIRYQELERARLVTGANKVKIGSDESPITDREWAAIQAGAVSASMLRSILSNANIDRVRELATPRATTSLTPGQIARARQLVNSGRPLSEVADLLGVPRSTLNDNLAN